MNNNKNILAIETSSNVCGISYIEKGSCVGCVEEDISKKHAEILPEFYLNLQKKTDFILDNMDAIAVSIGPGSFTGLRIGLSFAKGLAFSKDLPIVPISTMMSLAFTLKEDLPVIGIIHSHAKRVFCQKIRWDQRIPYPDGAIAAGTGHWNACCLAVCQRVGTGPAATLAGRDCHFRGHQPAVVRLG